MKFMASLIILKTHCCYFECFIFNIGNENEMLIIFQNEVKINMYSKDLCCMENNLTNKEIYKNISLTNILTSTILSNNTEINESSTIQNYSYESSETSEELIISNKEKNEESDLNYENNDTIYSQYYGMLIDDEKSNINNNM